VIKDVKNTGEEDGEKMMINNNLQLSEIEKAQISDLADGCLRGSAFADAMALLNSNSKARAYWHGLHLVGDVLRGETTLEATVNATATANDVAFLNSFRANLAKEPRLLPLAEPAFIEPVLAPKNPVTAKPSANDSFFNWKWMGGLSAAAAVVAFSWNMVASTATAPNGSGAQLAQSASQTTTTVATTVATPSAAGVMLRNPQLDALIAAHNQAGGSSALQMPSGFLRSATFNTSTSVAVVSDK
jgi:sigma-E factor negative regulatory protein RseA